MLFDLAELKITPEEKRVQQYAGGVSAHFDRGLEIRWGARVHSHPTSLSSSDCRRSRIVVAW